MYIWQLKNWRHHFVSISVEPKEFLTYSSIHSILVLISHHVSPFVPDFIPLFRPGLEGSWVEKMLSKKAIMGWMQQFYASQVIITRSDFFNFGFSSSSDRMWHKCKMRKILKFCHTEGRIFPVEQVEIQGKKRCCYLLKSWDLVAFDSSVQNEGGAETKDVS